MNRSLKKLLKRLYAENSMTCSEALKLLDRRFGDHRDFYPLAALVEADYLGWTGGMQNADEPFRRTMLAHALQCHSQGRGTQTYKQTIVKEGREEEYFYIGPKTIELFETRRSDSKKLLASAGLSFFAAVIVAVIAYMLRSGS